MDSNAVGLKHIGPYPLLARLGSGGMGTVYLALHRGVGGFEKKVAIKALLPHVADDKQFIGMLVDEAKLTAQLTHPNIVQVIDLAHAGQSHFLVMEYVEGVDARTLSEHHELTLDEAVYLAAEAARGLAYAHRKCGPAGEMLGIVHRDISGHNLLVSVEGVTKVMDFGIAKAASNRNATEVGVLKGKLAYMSPEQALGRSLDARSDLFSLGIVLWELCTRHRLFAGDTEMQILLKVQKCEIEPPSRFIQGFPRDLEDIILKCLAVNPEHRYSDGDRLADELHGFLRSHQGAVDPRSKLAQRVIEYLRSHPPENVVQEQTLQHHVARHPAPASLEQTQASSRNENTRINTPSAIGKPVRKPLRVSWRWVGGFVAVTAFAGGGWILGTHNPVAKVMKTVPVPERPENTVVAAVILPVPKMEQAPVESPKLTAGVPPAVLAVTNPEGNSAFLPPADVKKTPVVSEVKGALAKSTRTLVPQTDSKPGPPPRPEVDAKAPPAPADTASVTLPAGSVSGTGYVSINATPWARVYIDGVAVAESTPLLRYALPAGEHKVVLVNPELKIRKELQMRISPGEHSRQKVNLE